MADLANDLRTSLGPGAVLESRPLAQHTLLRVGGPADLLVVAETAEVLRRTVGLAWQHQAPCRVLGSGANVLVSDAGVRGLVVLNRARLITFPPRPDPGMGRATAVVRAESGASFSVVARQCVQRGLAGLEWAASIPGTVGGAVVGNAGAWGGDVASTLLYATILEPGGVVVDRPSDWFEYGYRTSLLKRRASPVASQAVVLEAEFRLQPGDRSALEARVAEIAAGRKASQPPGASCGSVFQNPPGDYAGRLIEAAGLKGQRRGGAEISALHANFIVNDGTATAADVRALIDLARQTVQDRFGVTLELEVELVGDW
jgi:UDP-N-acetylmuramate dehydrogenase